MTLQKTTPVLIDWLSFSALTKGYDIKELQLIKLDYGTSVFSCIEEIFIDHERIATITSVPYSKVLDEHIHIIKLDNWVLYSDKFMSYYSLIAKELQLVSIKISRIDICKDFNYFTDKRKPDNFIKAFLAGSVRKLGKSKFSVWGETNMLLSYDYLSIGKKSSPINVYLYNKSKELQQVKNKPHIRNKWEEYGLDDEKNIFRLEISIKKSDVKLVDRESGAFIEFGIKELFDQDILEDLYRTLLYKYFRFKHYTGKTNISRENDVILFEKEEYQQITWELVKGLESNRSDKIFLKKLDTMYSELRTEDVILFNAIEKLRNVFAERKHLIKYLDNKVTPNTLEMMERPDYFAAKLKQESLDIH